MYYTQIYDAALIARRILWAGLWGAEHPVDARLAPVLMPSGHRLGPTGSGAQWAPFRTDRVGRRDPADETRQTRSGAKRRPRSAKQSVRSVWRFNHGRGKRNGELLCLTSVSPLCLRNPDKDQAESDLDHSVSSVSEESCLCIVGGICL